MRSAESSRKSSCAFADRIASISVAHYRSVCPNDLRRAYRQTVLATIVLQIPNDLISNSEACKSSDIAVGEDSSSIRTKLIVASLGVGTKVVDAESIALERRQHGSVHGDRIVRDQHAEVLARRGFMRFLYEQLRDHMAHAEQRIPLFVPREEQHGQSVGLQFNPRIKVHMYTSSQPCGNACVKKWAKSSLPTFRSDLSIDQVPDEVHERFFPTAVSEGQTALLVKTNCSVAKGGKARFVDDARATDQDVSVFPAGTAPVSSGFGNVMTCSDKMARWNALGLQGALLSVFIPTPIKLSSVTVGRKFSRIHCQRALCCRLQDFSCKSTPPPTRTAGVRVDRYSISHPAMLGTHVKFDESAIITSGGDADGVGSTDMGPSLETATGAQFAESRTLVCVRTAKSFQTIYHGSESADDECASDAGSFFIEILDGRTGYLSPLCSGLASREEINTATESKICSSALFRVFEELTMCEFISNSKKGAVVHDYQLSKTLNANYSFARDLLLSSNGLFGGWIPAK